MFCHVRDYNKRYDNLGITLIRRHTPDGLERLFDQMQEPWCRTLVATDDYHQIVGYACVDMRVGPKHGDGPRIFALFVAKCCRRLNVGTDLVEAVMKRLWHEYQPLNAAVHQDAETAQHFFRSLGFHMADVLESTDGKGGKYYDFRYELPRVSELGGTRVFKRAA